MFQVSVHLILVLGFSFEILNMILLRGDFIGKKVTCFVTSCHPYNRLNSLWSK